MPTITTRATDGVYGSIAREAAKRGVSVDEVIDAWLVEGMQASSGQPDLPEELDAFYVREDHHSLWSI